MSEKIKNRRLWVLALLFVSVTTVFISCQGETSKNFIVEKITVGPINKTISATGVIEVLDTVPVLTKTTGIVNSIHVEADKKVKKGAILATLDVSDINHRLVRLSTILESSRLNYLSAKQSYEGKKKMFQENLISRIGFQQAELSYKKSLNTYRLHRLDYNHLLQQKKDAIIRAPIKGVIIDVSLKEKRPVGRNHAAFIMTSDLKKMMLIINVDEADIGSIKKNLNVKFTVSAYPDKKFYGYIKSVAINPVKRNGLVSYQSEVVCDNSELFLKPGMTATATIMVARRKKVLRAPNQAFMVTPDGSDIEMTEKILWVQKGLSTGPESFKKVKVKTGLAGDMFTEVKKNIKAGEKVLIKVEESED